MVVDPHVQAITISVHKRCERKKVVLYLQISQVTLILTLMSQKLIIIKVRYSSVLFETFIV
jgi:hypothetical protein